MSSLITPPPKLVAVARNADFTSPLSGHDGADAPDSGDLPTAAAAATAPPRGVQHAMPGPNSKSPTSHQRPIGASDTPRAAPAAPNPFSAFSLTDSPGLRVPQNTPADRWPVAAIRPLAGAAGAAGDAVGTVGTATPAGAGAGPGTGGPPVRGGSTHRPILFNSIVSRGVAHVITPGNTPSSLERISKRIAGNLLGDAASPAQGGGQSNAQGQLAPQNSLGGFGIGGPRIAPSYE